MLAETMERSGRAAIASFVMRDKSHAVAIFADGGILRAVFLRFADELRSAEAVGLPRPVAGDAASLRKVRKAVDELARPALDPDELRDVAPERLLALAERKRASGKDVVEVPASPDSDATDEPGGEVVDLMALLKRRLNAEGRARPRRARAKPAAKRPRAKPAARRTRGRPG